MAVYLVAPAGVYTGGPTALFQLCNALRRYGVNAIIAFYGKVEGDLLHPNYRKYGCPWVTINDIKDEKQNAIVTPETAIQQITPFMKVKKIIYWLAVDNYVLSSYKRSKLNYISYLVKRYTLDPYILYCFLTRKMAFYRHSYNAVYVKSLIDRKIVSIPNVDLHLAQSRYVNEFLRSMGVCHENIIMIHEPIEEEFLTNAMKVKDYEKVNAIAWNSRKAYPAAFKLVNALRKRGFTVFELANVGKEHMLKLLSRTKIFLDIGIHPGRDRPLREAVALDNIAVVNNHGGYYYFDDCMVPDEFKWDCQFDCKIDYRKCVEKIEYYLENFEYYIKKFYHFKQYILQEPYIFLNDVRHLAEVLEEWGVD